jgi:hypothetical protein
MSRSFLNKLQILKSVSVDSDVHPIAVGGLVGLVGLTIGGHACYTYYTKQTKTITIDKKYKFVRNGMTEFMVVDYENKHYNVNNSIWFWKWDSIEDWNNIKTGETLNVKYYGYRIPILGVFPNIVKVELNNKVEITE